MSVAASANFKPLIPVLSNHQPKQTFKSLFFFLLFFKTKNLRETSGNQNDTTVLSKTIPSLTHVFASSDITAGRTGHRLQPEITKRTQIDGRVNIFEKNCLTSFHCFMSGNHYPTFKNHQTVGY